MSRLIFRCLNLDHFSHSCIFCSILRDVTYVDLFPGYFKAKQNAKDTFSRTRGQRAGAAKRAATQAAEANKRAATQAAEVAKRAATQAAEEAAKEQLADTNGDVSSPVSSGTEDVLLAKRAATQAAEPAKRAATMTPKAAKAGPRPKATKPSRRRKVGKDANPLLLMEHTRSFIENAWGGKTKAKAKATAKAKEKPKATTKAKAKANAKVQAKHADKEGRSVAGLRVLIKSNKQSRVYLDEALYLPIQNAPGETEENFADKFEPGVTADMKGQMWYRGAVLLGQLSRGPPPENDIPPDIRPLYQNDLRTLDENPGPSVFDRVECSAEEELLATLASSELSSDQLGARHATFDDLVARQAAFELESDYGVSPLEQDAVLLLLGNVARWRWRQLCCVSSGEGVTWLTIARLQFPSEVSNLICDFVGTRGPVNREQLMSRVKFSLLKAEYDSLFSAAFDTKWQLTPSLSTVDLDNLHMILAWAFQSRARAAIYLNEKIVADGGEARTFSADKSKMDNMIGCADRIKYALQAGEWAQRHFEHAQESKRIVDAAQQRRKRLSYTKEEVQAHAEEQRDVEANLQTATSELESKRTIISELGPILVSVVIARRALVISGYPPLPAPVFSTSGGYGYTSDCYKTEEEEKGEMDEPEAGDANEGEEVLQEEETGRRDSKSELQADAAAGSSAGVAYPKLLAKMHGRGKKCTGVKSMKRYAEKLIREERCGQGWGTSGNLAYECWELARPGQREVKLAQMDKEGEVKQKLAAQKEKLAAQKEKVVDLAYGSSSDNSQSAAKRRRKGEGRRPQDYKIPKKTTGGHEKGVSDLLLPSCVSSILS